MLRLSSDLISIPGVGKSICTQMNDRGIECVEDVILARPKSYEDRSKIANFSQIEDKGPVNTFVRVLSKQVLPSNVLKVIVEDAQDFECVNPRLKRATLWCFGRKFLDKTLIVGNVYYLYGNAARKREYASSLQISQFEVKSVTYTQNGEYNCPYFGAVKPIFFRLNPALNTKMIAIGDAVLSLFDWQSEELSVENRFLSEHGLLSLREALRLKLHPSSLDDVEHARRAFAGVEVIRNFSQYSQSSSLEYTPYTLSAEEEKFISSLPFALTESQLRSVSEITSSQESSSATERLLQGEVGSGKTIVSFIAAYHEILKSNQVIMLAPTEILSYQHYVNAKKMFSASAVRIEHLSSSTRADEKKRIYRQLKNGDIDFLIGTHSLLNEKLEFKSLTFAIVDEEQRFGTLQKTCLAKKGKCVHTLFASATPIPRSIMRVFSSRINCSTLDQVPSGRLPVKTLIVSPQRRLEAYKTIMPEFEKGHCAYFIVPRIEDDENEEYQSIKSLEEQLSSLFKGVNYAVIHSRIKDAERKEIFQKFMSAEIQYLIATSVVEVGMDNPLATVIFIEDADMFGLSTLHQLRGRVGRGELQSWCFLSYREGITESGKERLRAIKDNLDGFVIAEKDLMLRGSGDLLGTRQSGKSLFAYFDAQKDIDLID